MKNLVNFILFLVRALLLLVSLLISKGYLSAVEYPKNLPRSVSFVYQSSLSESKLTLSEDDVILGQFYYLDAIDKAAKNEYPHILFVIGDERLLAYTFKARSDSVIWVSTNKISSSADTTSVSISPTPETKPGFYVVWVLKPDKFDKDYLTRAIATIDADYYKLDSKFAESIEKSVFEKLNSTISVKELKK